MLPPAAEVRRARGERIPRACRALSVLAEFREAGASAIAASDAHTVAAGAQAVRSPIVTVDGPVVHLRLPFHAEVEADLCNVAGQLVRRIASGRYEAGEHTLPLRGAAPATHEPLSGVYFLRLRVDGVNSAQRLVAIQ
jgi:hypothetical protein